MFDDIIDFLLSNLFGTTTGDFSGGFTRRLSSRAD
jgi:hypothetical protein